MDIFVTGAAGYIGSAVVTELLSAGHTVSGLSRSDAGSARLEALGATVARGELADVDGVAAYAAASDGVVHLAFDHGGGDLTDTEAPGRLDLAVIERIGAALAGSGKPFVTTSGTLIVAGSPTAATEDQAADLTQGLGAMRGPSEEAVLALADRGVAASFVRLAPSVHSDADRHGFVPTLVEVARSTGVSAYVGDGTARWPGVHRSDAARLYRLAVEQAPSGVRLHGVAEEGVPFREIAEAIGRLVGVPTTSIAPEQAGDHFGWIGMLAAMDDPVSSARTRELLGWEPTGPTLVADIDGGAYSVGPAGSVEA
jgi:nucleoside-diphosphate-sugar epimerase